MTVLNEARPDLRRHRWTPCSGLDHAGDRVCRPVHGVVSIMTTASGSADVKAKAVLGWTRGHPTWRDGFPTWAAEAQRSNTRKAA